MNARGVRGYKVKKTWRKRVKDTEERLRNYTIADKREIDSISYYKTQRFLKPKDLDESDYRPCEVGFSWSRNRQHEPKERATLGSGGLSQGGNLCPEMSLGDSVWFKLNFKIPQVIAGLPTYLRFVVNPVEMPEGSPLSGRPAVEALCYKEGQPWQALDHGHHEILLPKNAQPGTSYDLDVEVGTTLYWGGLELDRFTLEAAELVATREEVQKLYRTFKVLNDLRKDLKKDSVNRTKILKGLHRASLEIPATPDNEKELLRGTEAALEELEHLKQLSSEISDFTVSTMGHAHIDAAWLWPWSETVRKTGRTFSTALKLMEEYPQFKFLQSQPHLYEFVKKHYPDLFDRISQAVKDDNWEPVGALWVESDVNLAGGETLTRQYLYGKKYFRAEFGVDPKITFIPDVFGYSPALPGIAKAADCPYFFTQKMSWSEVNEFPHHSFQWEGIDGSSILAHFPPAETYNGMTMDNSVSELRKSAKEYKEKEINSQAAYLIGWGDGGGGVNREMIETTEVVNEIEALPDIEFSSLKGFFNDLEEYQEQLDSWRGELYLERHRGTLTTQGQTKKNNRELEFLLRETELWSTLAALRKGDFDYPREELKVAWKGYLFQCFHDILPGSSITEVYEDAKRDYREIRSRATDLLNSALEEFLSLDQDSNHISVMNSLPWEMTRVVKSKNPGWEEGKEIRAVDEEGKSYLAQVTSEGDELVFEGAKLPAMGIKSFEIKEGGQTSPGIIKTRPQRLENQQVAVKLDEEGNLQSVYDKECKREVLQGRGNRLVAYQDVPTEFNAWELEGDIYEKGEQIPAPMEIEVLETGPVRGLIRQKRSFGDSEIVQDIVLYKGSKRIDIETTVDWHEEKVLLKSHFPIRVRADEATYEVQYGHYNRPTHSNTSWDQARFEVFHQKWVDVAEYGYGAALLNDGKYGVNVEGSTIGLSLLRAPKSPDPEADMGKHHFTYSLLPHRGDFREAGVIEEAYDLNDPARAGETKDFDSLAAPFEVEDRGVIPEAVKMAEDREDMLVIRFYEAWGREVSTKIHFDFEPETVYRLNSVEDRKRKIPIDGWNLKLSFDAFEIKTVGVVFNG
mgnify:CR=1 FL=1